MHRRDNATHALPEREIYIRRWTINLLRTCNYVLSAPHRLAAYLAYNTGRPTTNNAHTSTHTCYLHTFVSFTRAACVGHAYLIKYIFININITTAKGARDPAKGLFAARRAGGLHKLLKTNTHTLHYARIICICLWIAFESWVGGKLYFNAITFDKIITVEVLILRY